MAIEDRNELETTSFGRPSFAFVGGIVNFTFPPANTRVVIMIITIVARALLFIIARLNARSESFFL